MYVQSLALASSYELKRKMGPEMEWWWWEGEGSGRAVGGGAQKGRTQLLGSGGPWVEEGPAQAWELPLAILN